jgi:HSP20 family protein
MTLPSTRPTRQTQQPAEARRGAPVQQLEDVYERMARLLQGFFGQTVPEILAGKRWAPPADIEETDDAFIVEIDVPGVKAEDIDIELQENQIRVSGEVKEGEHKGVMRRQTRQTGQFEHLVLLPGEVDPDTVEATLSDGVLTVRLNKAARRQSRHIQVQGS